MPLSCLIVSLRWADEEGIVPIMYTVEIQSGPIDKSGKFHSAYMGKYS